MSLHGVFRTFILGSALLASAAFAQNVGSTINTLYRFAGGGDGSNPNGAMAAPDGALYGTTAFLGYSAGAIFELTPPTTPGGLWTKYPLYSYCCGLNVGSAANPALALGPDGRLYGTTYDGGFNNNGTVFAVPVLVGGGSNYRILHKFSPSEGIHPLAGVAFDKSG